MTVYVVTEPWLESEEVCGFVVADNDTEALDLAQHHLECERASVASLAVPDPITAAKWLLRALRRIPNHRVVAGAKEIVNSLGPAELTQEIENLAVWTTHKSGPHRFLRPEDEIDRQVGDEFIERFHTLEQNGDSFESFHEALWQFRTDLEDHLRSESARLGLDPLTDLESVEVLSARVRREWSRRGPGVTLKPLYERLTARKERGVSLNFDHITEEELYTLWYAECHPDSVIADLYGVQQGDVRKKRYKWGIKLYSPIPHSILSSLGAQQVAPVAETREAVCSGCGTRTEFPAVDSRPSGWFSLVSAGLDMPFCSVKCLKQHVDRL